MVIDGQEDKIKGEIKSVTGDFVKNYVLKGIQEDMHKKK